MQRQRQLKQPEILIPLAGFINSNAGSVSVWSGTGILPVRPAGCLRERPTPAEKILQLP